MPLAQAAFVLTTLLGLVRISPPPADLAALAAQAPPTGLYLSSMSDAPRPKSASSKPAAGGMGAAAPPSAVAPPPPAVAFPPLASPISLEVDASQCLLSCEARWSSGLVHLGEAANLELIIVSQVPPRST